MTVMGLSPASALRLLLAPLGKKSLSAEIGCKPGASGDSTPPHGESPPGSKAAKKEAKGEKTFWEHPVHDYGHWTFQVHEQIHVILA